MKYAVDSKLSLKVQEIRTKNDRMKMPECLQDNKKAEIFIGLTNALFQCLPHREREDFLEELGNPQQKHVGIIANPNRFTGDDIVQFASEQLNRRRVQAACIVSELLGIKPEYCFDVGPATRDTESDASPSVMNRIENELEPIILFDFIPEKIQVGEEIYILSFFDDLYSFDGSVEQKLCHYSNTNKQNFLLIASSILVNIERRKKKILGIGYAPATAWPFSRVAIDKFSDAPVIFPMSLHVAFHLRKICREASLNERDCIVSGYAGDTKTFDAHCFYGRNVILLPIFSRDGYSAAIDFASMLRNAGASDVKIYPWPIMALGMPADAMTAGSGSPWKHEFLDKKVDLSEQIAPSSFLNKIIKTALSVPNFENLLAEVGLTAPKECPSQKKAEALPISTLNEIMDSPEISIDTDPSLDLIIKPHFILFMWGGSNTGKSFILLTFILGIASGTQAFFFAGSNIPRNVLLLDGELTNDQFKQRLKQLTRNKHSLFESVKKHIFCHFARETGSLDLLNPEHQKKILARIRQDNIKVLAIDNLISLADKALKGRTNELFDFFYSIEREGAAVIFVNHATKDNDDFKGPSNIRDKSQTIIHIEGRKTLIDDENSSEAVKHALKNSEDIVVRLNFEKCKLPPKLNEKYGIYHLPVDGNWNYLEGNVPVDTPLCVTTLDDDETDDKTSSDGDLNNNDSLLCNLTEDQQALYKLFLSGKVFSRADIQEHFQWGEDKAGNELKALKKKQLIIAVGSGRNIRYKKK